MVLLRPASSIASTRDNEGLRSPRSGRRRHLGTTGDRRQAGSQDVGSSVVVFRSASGASGLFASPLLLVVTNERVHVVSGQGLTARQERELDDESAADNAATELLDQICF